MSVAPAHNPSNPLYIGVIAATDHEYGRRILLGVRSWCEAHPGIRLNIITTQGQIGPIQLGLRFVGIVGFLADQASAANALKLSPQVVNTSNRYPLPGVTQVITDDYAVGALGARYLLGRGLRQLVFLERSVYTYSDQRARGFGETAQRLGANVHRLSWSKSEPLTEILALPKPVGIMAVSDTTAREFLEMLDLTLYHVPQDIAVLGVNNDPLDNALSPVGLSSIKLAGETIGYRAAEAVYRQYLSQPVQFPILVPPLQVVTRRSTNVFAVSDPLVERTLRLMRNRPADLRLARDLVTALKVPRRTLELRFRQATGHSLYQELTECHLETARQLLASSDLAIGEIAQRSGFSEPRLLSLVFRRITGMTPTAYRQLFQAKG